MQIFNLIIYHHLKNHKCYKNATFIFVRILKKIHARIGFSEFDDYNQANDANIDWWLSIYAESKDEAIKIIRKCTHGDFIIKEVDDRYDNALSKLLSEVIDIPIGDLLDFHRAEIKELHEEHSLEFEDDDLVGYENKKGVSAAGLRLFGKYDLKRDYSDY